MRKLLVTLGIVAAIAGGLFLFLRQPLAQTTEAALRAYPVYSFVRTRNDSLLFFRHQGLDGANRLQHRRNLSDWRDRFVTTPNNDTLYSLAFLDLSAGPVGLKMPPLPARYHSVAVMDAQTDNIVVAGTRDGGTGGELLFYYGDKPPADAGNARLHRLTTPQAWLLVRTLVDGPADLEAARAAQSGFELLMPEVSRRPAQEAVALPVLPDPAMLLRRANPVIAESPHLQDAALAATGYGGSADAFDKLPMWRQWLWRAMLPRIFERMKSAIAAGARTTGDGWAKTPPGIGTSAATPALRSAIALAGLGALPADEAVYWSAVIDGKGQELDGSKRYRLTIPADVPVRAFWSMSLYERLADGRLFYVENPIDRYAVGNRSPGLQRNADGSLTLVIQPDRPADAANWLPAPKGRLFTLIFRAYLPDQPILAGTWRLPAVEQTTE